MVKLPALAAIGLLLTACGTSDDAEPTLGASSSDDGSSSGSGVAELACTPEAGLELYERRIAPLLEDDRPSTCNQCHLSGVDLSLFLQATPCETMACMIDQGLVDLSAPDDSLVLEWIERATPQGGITEQTIATEHDAMLEWIEMVAACDGSLCEPVAEPCGNPTGPTECPLPDNSLEPRPFDDPGDCSDLTLELMFREKIYAWRSRCYPCHFDSLHDQLEEAPPWIVTGDCNPGSLGTLRNVERNGYLRADAPLQSLLLLKPLDESLGGVPHGGHAKINSLDDPGYIDFTYFLERWAACQP